MAEKSGYDADTVALWRFSDVPTAEHPVSEWWTVRAPVALDVVVKRWAFV